MARPEKLGTLEGEGRTPYMFLLTPDGSRNDQIWTAYGNYENNSQKRGRFYKGFAALESILEDDDDQRYAFVLEFREARPSLVTMNVSSGDMKSIRRLPEKTMYVWGAQKRKMKSRGGIDLLVSVAARGKENLLEKTNIYFRMTAATGRKFKLTMDGFDGPWAAMQGRTDNFLVATAQKTKAPMRPLMFCFGDRKKGEWSGKII